MNKSYDVYMCRPKPVIFRVRIPTIQEKLQQEMEIERFMQDSRLRIAQLRIQSESDILKFREKSNKKAFVTLSAIIAFVILINLLPRI